MIEIDGSFGEGGGQILRTCLTLSSLLGKPFRIRGIRSNRENPGLQAQHLASVRLMKMLTDARVKGDYLGSTELEFEPGPIREGEFSIDVGTAGSVSLVAVTAIPIMINRRIALRIRGGTDVPLAPPIDYMRLVFLEVLEMAGVKGEIEVVRRGHYPQGGGEVIVKEFRGNLEEFSFNEFGDLKEISGISHSTSLPTHIARRQIDGAREILADLNVPLKVIEDVTTPGSKGTGIVLVARGKSIMGSSNLGEKGVMAETVGRIAAQELVRELRSGGAVDSHMSDMLVTFSAMVNVDYTGSILTPHVETNVQVVKKFINVELSLQGRSPFRLKSRVQAR